MEFMALVIMAGGIVVMWLFMDRMKESWRLQEEFNKEILRANKGLIQRTQNLQECVETLQARVAYLQQRKEEVDALLRVTPLNAASTQG